jgi:hypothetical protein
MADDSRASESTPATPPAHAVGFKEPTPPVAIPEAGKMPAPGAEVEPVPAKPASLSPPAVKAASTVASVPPSEKGVAPAGKKAGPVETKAGPVETPTFKAPPVEAKSVVNKSAPASPAVQNPATPVAPVAKAPVTPKASSPIPAPAKAPIPEPAKALIPAPAQARPIAAPPIPSAKRATPAATPPVSAKFTAVPISNYFQETFAMTTPTFDFAAAFKTAFSDAQEKAKAAYEKSTLAMGDASEFAKGNVEALVESSKILASGLQELTTELVAESREAFENLTAEVKTIAAVKSPADFFKLQSELMRKQMDALMANGAKHSEAFLKLATDAAAPLSSRVSLAVEKVKTAA